MLAELNEDLFLDLYREFTYDLKKVRFYQSKLYAQQGFSSIEMHLIPKLLQRITELLYRPIGVPFYLALRSIIWSFESANNEPRMKPQLSDIEAELTYLLIRKLIKYLSMTDISKV